MTNMDDNSIEGELLPNDNDDDSPVEGEIISDDEFLEGPADNTTRNFLMAGGVLLLLICCCCFLSASMFIASGILDDLAREFGLVLRTVEPVSSAIVNVFHIYPQAVGK